MRRSLCSKIKPRLWTVPANSTSYHVYHVSAQGVEGRMINEHLLLLLYPLKWLQRCLVVTWLVLCETARRLYLGSSSVYTIQPCNSLQCHFIQSHLRRVHARLALTCHLHFRQNDQNLLHATAVTRVGTDTEESEQKVDLGGKKEKKKERKKRRKKREEILPPLLPGLEPENFRSRGCTLRMSIHPCSQVLRRRIKGKVSRNAMHTSTSRVTVYSLHRLRPQ